MIGETIHEATMKGFRPFMMEAFKAIANPSQQPNGTLFQFRQDSEIFVQRKREKFETQRLSLQ